MADDTKQIDDGGPAFPTDTGAGPYADGFQNGSDTFHHYGMTLRNYYAAKAMAAVIVLTDATANIVPGKAQAIAENAFRIADAMIAAGKAK